MTPCSARQAGDPPVEFDFEAVAGRRLLPCHIFPQRATQFRVHHLIMVLAYHFQRRRGAAAAARAMSQTRLPNKLSPILAPYAKVGRRGAAVLRACHLSVSCLQQTRSSSFPGQMPRIPETLVTTHDSGLEGVAKSETLRTFTTSPIPAPTPSVAVEPCPGHGVWSRVAHSSGAGACKVLVGGVGLIPGFSALAGTQSVSTNVLSTQRSPFRPSNRRGDETPTSPLLPAAKLAQPPPDASLLPSPFKGAQASPAGGRAVPTDFEAAEALAWLASGFENQKEEAACGDSSCAAASEDENARSGTRPSPVSSAGHSRGLDRGQAPRRAASAQLPRQVSAELTRRPSAKAATDSLPSKRRAAAGWCAIPLPIVLCKCQRLLQPP